MKVFNKIVSGFMSISFGIGMAALVFSMLFTATNIVVRLFGRAIVGNVEIITNTNVVIAWMGFGLCALHDGHIKVDIIKGMPFLTHFCSIITLAGVFLFGYLAINQGMISYQLKTLTANLNIVKWPFFFICALGYFSMGVSIINFEVNSFVNWLHSKRNPDTTAPEAE